MSSAIARGIYQGQINVEGTSGLRNPVVKLLYLFGPAFVLVSQQVLRLFGYPILSNFDLLVLLCFLFTGSTLDFSQRGFPIFLRRILTGFLLVSGLIIVLSDRGRVAESLFVLFTDKYRILPILEKVHIDIKISSWILISFIVVMFSALRNITTRDAFWLGRALLWRYAFDIYSLFVITFATIFSSLKLRLETSWIVAKDKSLLMRNPRIGVSYSRTIRFYSRFKIFTLTLLFHNSNMAASIETLAYQRGLFRDRYRDHRLTVMSREDSIAVGLLVLAILIILASHGLTEKGTQFS